MFNAVEKISAPQQVAQQLKEAIFSGKLPMGSKLPSERELASELGVSRPVLREAIVMLASYGLIYSKQGDGNFIVDNSSESILAFVGFGDSLTADNYNYFFECRELFEVGVVNQIVANCTVHAVRELTEINRVFSEEASKEVYCEAEIKFHRLLMSLCQNPLVLELYSIVLKFMQTSASYLLTTQRIRTQAYEAHQKIIKALVRKDDEEFRKAVEEHLSVSRNNLKCYFEERQQ